MKTSKKIIRLVPRLVVSVILLQTLWFKFGIGGQKALEESQMLFISLSNMLFGTDSYEGLFRIGTGILELMVSITIFTKYSGYAAILGILIMLGALASHLFFIGISINGDAGLLMMMAIVVLICCLKVAYDERKSAEAVS